MFTAFRRSSRTFPLAGTFELIDRATFTDRRPSSRFICVKSVSLGVVRLVNEAITAQSRTDRLRKGGGGAGRRGQQSRTSLARRGGHECGDCRSPRAAAMRAEERRLG